LEQNVSPDSLSVTILPLTHRGQLSLELAMLTMISASYQISIKS